MSYYSQLKIPVLILAKKKAYMNMLLLKKNIFITGDFKLILI